MKIRVISDLHIDVNRHIPIEYDDDIFTVVCGDVSGYAEDTIEWVKNNVRRGVFVEGNHIAYSGKYTIPESHAQLEYCFPLGEDVSYLNNSYKVVDEIVFVGGTLWTNFRLGFPIDINIPEKGIEEAAKYAQKNMAIAKVGMNDYRLNRLTDGLLQPENTFFWFYETMETIANVCEKFSNKKIVVVTHHAPSARSLDERYVNSIPNPCYASDMDAFIEQNQNIALWCHGHIHEATRYQIGNTEVVCNPRGYVSYGESCGFDKDLIVEI